MSWGNSKLQVQILMFYTCVSFWDILNPNIARAANEVPCHQECKGLRDIEHRDIEHLDIEHLDIEHCGH